MPKFARYVHVTDPETGQSQAFKPGDDAPDWAVELVDEKNFEEGEEVAPVPNDAIDATKLEATGGDEAQLEGQTAHAVPPSEPVSDLGSGEGYDAMTNAELTAMLKERGLPSGGTKREMIERLEQDDRGVS